MSRKFQIKAVPSSWLEENNRRLDCGPYMSGAIESKMILRGLRVETNSLRSLTERGDEGIFKGKMIKRIFVEDETHGAKFLNTSNMLASDLREIPLLSKKIANSDKDCFVSEGTILVSAAGTIGRTAYVRGEMAGMFACSDIMKIIPDERKVGSGYLYAFLSSRFGVPLLTSGTFGSIIQHIEAFHISALPVPRFDGVEQKIDALIKDAAKLRTEASSDLLLAGKMIQSELNVPQDKTAHSLAQVVKASEVIASMRMEGFYHNSRARELECWAKDHTNGYWQLGDIADVYDVPPFKHIYVEPEVGVPFYTSGELFRLDRKADKFLSKTETKDLHKYILEEGWILLARSGQLGGIICRPQFSDSALAGSATSDHVIRIVPNISNVPAGYIYSYLALSTLGYPLLTRTMTGTSIPALWPIYLKPMPMVKASEDLMAEVDELTLGAFEKRVTATKIEDDAIALVERAIEEGGR